MNVITNIGRKFLNLISKHFPKEHKFHSTINRSNVKVSYGCMDNMASFIWSTTRRSSEDNGDLPCNCRNSSDCPVNGECRSKSVIYKAVVKSDDATEKVYYGRCETEFKLRYNNHTSSFRNNVRPNSTELCKYIHSLKNRSVGYSINWSIVRRAATFKNGAKNCDLCLTEKYCIAIADQESLLNERNEFISKCPHEKKYYIGSCIKWFIALFTILIIPFSHYSRCSTDLFRLNKFPLILLYFWYFTNAVNYVIIIYSY